MFEELLNGLVEALALHHLDRCARGREADRGFDCGEFDRARPGEEEADDVLHASGFYWRLELEDLEDRLGTP